MNICFHDQAWEDYLYWQKTDKKLLKRINELIKDVVRHPDTGIGKPEPLKYSMAGAWSRRIDHIHRLVYQIQAKDLVILQCRYHY